MKNLNVRRLVYAALCLALCMILPFVTMHIQTIGQALSPMHLPVFLCGFLCGWPYGLVVGAVAPLLRSVIFGMPPLFPTAAAMAVELAVYGFASGLLYKLFPKKIPYVYVSLVIAMIAGRICHGLTMFAFMGFDPSKYGFSKFIAADFTGTLPGIVVQLVLIPVIVIALRKAKLTANE